MGRSLGELLKDPIIQECLARARREGGRRVAILCSLILEEGCETETKFNNVSAFRAEMVMKYGEPDPLEVADWLQENAELWPHKPDRLAAMRRLYRQARAQGLEAA